MALWTAKDPDAKLDYVYTIPLDEGDSVTSYLFERLSGTVVIESDSRSGANVTAVLSGGADGELAVFKVSWETTGGREDEEVIGLPVVANEFIPLLLTDYAKPAAAHLIIRYPAFAAVATSTIAYWLTDAERYVTDAWSEGDYAAGLMALAAHNMALAGLGTEAAAVSGIPAGVTRFKSGSFEAQFTEQQANAAASGDLTSTRYGQEYAALLRRNRAGARVTPTGVAPSLDYPPYGGIAGF